MKKAGVKGVVVKLTEGTTYKNPYAATQIANARTAGLVVGAYHYSHFTSDSGAKAEANYFADAANSFGLGSSTYMADDLEDSSTKVGSVQNNAMAFANQLKSRGFSRPMLYTYQSYVQQTGLNPSAFGDSNIWIASYPYAPSADANWYPQYGMWQFNSNTHFPGVSGGFDVSIDNKGVMGGNVITDVKDVMKVATFGQSGRNDGIYMGAPWDVSGAFKWQDAGQYNGQPILVTQQYTTTNSLKWASWIISNDERVWMDWNGLSNVRDVSNVNKRAFFSNGKTGRNDGLYLYSPNGFFGSKWWMTVKESGQDNKYVNVTKEFTYNGVTWYGANVNGKLVWFDSKAVTLDNTAAKSVNYTVEIKQSGRNDGIFVDQPWEYGATQSGKAKDMDGKSFVANKEWTTPDGVTWVSYAANGKQYYLDKAGVQVTGTPKTESKTIVISQKNRNDNLYIWPHNFLYEQFGESAKKFDGKAFPVVKSMTGSGGVTWYQLKVGDQLYWVDKDATQIDQSKRTPVNYTATVSQQVRNDGLYIDVPWTLGGKRYDSAKKLNQMQVEVTEEWTTSDGVTWVRFSYHNKSLLMDKRGISKISDELTNNIGKKVYIDQSNRNDGIYANQPWNFANSSWKMTAKSAMSATPYTVQREIVGVSDVHWYVITINGAPYWIDSAATVDANTTTKTTDYTAKINQAGRNDGLFYTVPWSVGGPSAGKASQYNGQTINVGSEWTTRDGVTWVGFYLNGKVTYMDKRGVSFIANAENVNRKVMINQSSRTDGWYATAPRGFIGASYQGSIKNNDHLIATVERVVVNADNERWYLIRLNGKGMWVHDLAVMDDNSEQYPTSYAALIEQAGRNDGLFTDAPWNYGTTMVGRATKYNQQEVQVTAEWTTPDNIKWVKINLDGQDVWMDSRGIKRK